MTERIERKSDKLKPCPFCGGSGEAAPEMVYVHNAYYARCGNERCLVMPTTDYYKEEDRAVEAWNRRADDD